MQAWCAGPAHTPILELSPALRVHVATRKGDWIIRVPVTSTYAPWLPYLRFVMGVAHEEVAIVYTAEEYTRLAGIIENGCGCETKRTSLRASISACKRHLWGTGSFDHVAMTHYGDFGVVQYMTGASLRLVGASMPGRKLGIVCMVGGCTLMAGLFVVGARRSTKIFCALVCVIAPFRPWWRTLRPSLTWIGATPATTAADTETPPQAATASIPPQPASPAALSPPPGPSEDGSPPKFSLSSIEDEPLPPIMEATTDPMVPQAPAQTTTSSNTQQAAPVAATATKSKNKRAKYPDQAYTADVALDAVGMPLAQPLGTFAAIANTHPNGGDDASDFDLRGEKTSFTTQVSDEVIAIVGKSVSSTDPLKKMGVIVLPVAAEPNSHLDTGANVQCAIRERITKKQNRCKATSRDKRRVKELVRCAIEGTKGHPGMFSTERIIAYLESCPELQDMKSAKWSAERFAGAVNQLWRITEPEMRVAVSIKAECAVVGKSPRMILADGDLGQIMALLCIKIFEELMFSRLEDLSIKHTSKKAAMFERVIASLQTERGRLDFMEGDGSAWDTTNTDAIRKMFENPILAHITKVVIDYPGVGPEWLLAHTKLCESKKLKLFHKGGMQFTIDAIRRSGHRGTSCLNFWVNFGMWVVSIFETPSEFLDPDRRWGRDLCGNMRKIRMFFEGDDSLIGTRVKLEDQLKVGAFCKDSGIGQISYETWKRFGFNMKFVYVKDRAEFCGWHFHVKDGRMTGIASPDLPRAFRTGGCSYSTSAKLVAASGDIKQFRALASATALSRADAFSGILPVVSEKYLQYSLKMGAPEWTHEQKMSTGHEKPDGIVEKIRIANMSVPPGDVARTCRALRYTASGREVEEFMMYEWSTEGGALRDFDGFRASLPVAWRP